MNHIFTRFVILMTPLFAWTQVPFFTNVDVHNGLLSGQITATCEPFDMGSVFDIFDGNTETMVRSAAINPLVLTLDFHESVSFGQTEIMNGAGNAHWTLECAQTLADLQSASGTYQLIFSQIPLEQNLWNVQQTEITTRFLRLTLYRITGDDFVHLREWKINGTITRQIESICLSPSVIRMPKESVYQPGVFLVDTAGNYHSVSPQLLTWSGSVPSVCEINGTGSIQSFSTNATTTLHAEFQSLQTSFPVTVSNDYTPEKPEIIREVNVALVVIDPPSEVLDGSSFSQFFGWENPATLAQKLCDSLNAASGGVVHYNIHLTYEDGNLYTLFGNTQIDADSLAHLLLEPEWTTLHDVAESQGLSSFLYNDLLNHYNFCDMSDQGIIDEVWVYAMPYVGLYESRLTGDNAFFYNAPPLTGNSCSDHLPIMGFNYERGLAEAWHSYGHRVENALLHLFGGWDNLAPLNTLDLFTLRDEHIPDSGQVGNIHFPVNATADYEYESTIDVTSYAVNWLSYPYMFDFHQTVNCTAWSCSQLGYMSWWHRHIPNKKCRDKSGYLNNWWSYVVDFNEGKAIERATPLCDCDPFSVVGFTNLIKTPVIVSPNPTSGIIVFETTEEVAQIEIYSVNGQITSLIIQVTDNQSDLSFLAPGVYIGKLETIDGQQDYVRIVRI